MTTVLLLVVVTLPNAAAAPHARQTFHAPWAGPAVSWTNSSVHNRCGAAVAQWSIAPGFNTATGRFHAKGHVSAFGSGSSLCAMGTRSTAEISTVTIFPAANFSVKHSGTFVMDMHWDLSGGFRLNATVGASNGSSRSAVQGFAGLEFFFYIEDLNSGKVSLVSHGGPEASTHGVSYTVSLTGVGYSGAVLEKLVAGVPYEMFIVLHFGAKVHVAGAGSKAFVEIDTGIHGAPTRLTSLRVS